MISFNQNVIKILFLKHPIVILFAAYLLGM